MDTSPSGKRPQIRAESCCLFLLKPQLSPPELLRYQQLRGSYVHSFLSVLPTQQSAKPFSLNLQLARMCFALTLYIIYHAKK